jgi:O-antigen/teichoic acid export membrane protein
MGASNDRASAEPQPPAEEEPGIGSRAAAGVMWLTAQRWIVRISGFVTIAVLTRFLSPADFGTVAAATTVLPFFYLLSDLGFAAYIVQVTKTTRRMLSTGFWFSVTAGVLLTGLMILVAPAFGAVFRSAEVVPVLQVMSAAIALTAFGSVPMALLRRSMRFRTLAVQGTIAALTAQVVAVTMTLTGMGVWALVGQILTAQLLISTLPWFTAKWGPSFAFSWGDLRAIAGFGSKVVGVEFIAATRAWAEAAIISAVVGMTGLGYLNIAQRLVQIVQDLTGSAVVPVSTVAFAKVRESLGRLRDAYLRALRLAYATLAPPLTLVAVAAPVIVPIVFGPAWGPSEPVAQILALAGIMVVGATLDHGLFYGVGKPGRWFVYAVIVDAATVGMTAVTAHLGIQAVAWGFLAVCVLSTAARWFLVARILSTGPLRIAGPFGFLLISVAVSGAAGWGVMWATAALPDLVRLILVGLAVLAASLLVMLTIARPVLKDAIELLGRFRFLSRFANRRARVEQ